MQGFFSLDNAVNICLGAWAVGFPFYLAFRKYLGFNTPSKFTTTEFKKKFKKHQLMFNEEFKQNKLFK